MMKKLMVSGFVIAGAALPWLGGGYTWIGFFCLLAALLIGVRPVGGPKADAAAQAEADNLRHGHPSRDTTRSDYYLHSPPGGGIGGGPGDGGSV